MPLSPDERLILLNERRDMMEPGDRKIDVEIARKVIGWTDVSYREDVPLVSGRPPGEIYLDVVPFYSKYIEEAMYVKDILVHATVPHFSFAMWDVPLISSVQSGVMAAFKYGSVRPPERTDKAGTVFAASVNPSLAICKAALKAIDLLDQTQSKSNDKEDIPTPDRSQD